MIISRASLLLLFLVSGCLIWLALSQPRLVSPTPETESAFLKTYTPNKVIDRFKAAGFSEESVGTSSGADRGFAAHEKDFEPTLVIHTTDSVALVQALRDDFTSSLVAQGGQVVALSGNPVDGFTIKYALGKSEGTFDVGPLRSLPASSLQAGESGSGKVTVSLRIRIAEKWFKSRA